MRITARLEPSTAQQLQYLVERMGTSTSDVLRKGIDALYQQHAPQKQAPLPRLARHIGKYKLGDAQWSSHYKAELADILDAKFPPSKPASSTAKTVSPSAVPSKTTRSS